MTVLLFPATVSENAPDLSVRVLTVVKRALSMSDLTLEKAALWMGQDRAHLHRQLSGDGHLSLARMAQLPVTFWMWFGLLLVEEYGLPKEAQRAARVALTVLGRKKMAKAFAAQQPQRRSA